VFRCSAAEEIDLSPRQLARDGGSKGLANPIGCVEAETAVGDRKVLLVEGGGIQQSHVAGAAR